MRLGESLQKQRLQKRRLQKRRGRAGKSGGGGSTSRRGGGVAAPGAGRGRLASLALLVVLVGFGGGYLIATRALFPAPPPPGDLLEVPGIQGLALARAWERLDEAGLVLGAITGFRHPDLDSGVVVGQGPLPGQLAAPGDPVRVTVSLGPLLQEVPDVARLRGDRALRVLEATGFQVTVDSTSAELPAGRVVAVTPEAGTILPVPGEVRVTLSRGPPLVVMPYLLGMPEQQAVDSLAALGLTVSEVDTVFRFGRDQGLVVDQAPLADSLLLRGADVRLSVGRQGGR